MIFHSQPLVSINTSASVFICTLPAQRCVMVYFDFCSFEEFCILKFICYVLYVFVHMRSGADVQRFCFGTDWCKFGTYYQSYMNSNVLILYCIGKCVLLMFDDPYHPCG